MIKSLMLAAVLAASAAPALAQSNTMSSSTTSGAMSSGSATSSGGMSASGAAAKPNPAMAKVRTQCAADFQKTCPNLKPGTPEMTQCVRDNFTSMSEGCQGALMEYMQSQGG